MMSNRFLVFITTLSYTARSLHVIIIRDVDDIQVAYGQSKSKGIPQMADLFKSDTSAKAV